MYGRDDIEEWSTGRKGREGRRSLKGDGRRGERRRLEKRKNKAVRKYIMERIYKEAEKNI